MAWADGLLYQATLNGVVSLSEDGSTRTVLRSGFAGQVWVEGDQLLFSIADQLWSMPRAGGEATLLLDGGHQNDPGTQAGERDMVDGSQWLDAEAFYWTTWGYPDTNSIHVWRMLRVGGTLEGFAPVPIWPVDGLAVVDDGVLVTGQSTVPGGRYYGAYVAGWAQAPARALVPDGARSPSPSWAISVQPTGYLWGATRAPAAGGYEVWWSPADGSTSRLLSEQLPPELFPQASVADDAGRLIGGSELFDDGASHGSVWRVDADGSARPMACDPPARNASMYSAVMAPDAVYWVYMVGSAEWAIVKTPRR